MRDMLVATVRMMRNMHASIAGPALARRLGAEPGLPNGRL